MTAYDKAKYHYENDFPNELSQDQAYVHIGFFLGWLIEKDLCSEEFLEDFIEDIEAFKARKLTSPQLLKKAAGVLASDMLSEEGNAFTESGYDSYMSDYLYFLDQEDAESVYHVPDTWENYEMIRERLDEEYEIWSEK
ncbi:DUF7832 domain-containing protein [Paenibacillus endoradicis]|uniref:DUF7832 domain-containing protein n=1 Tax=Paenibacillus endoradicis TaxID=2972487 RepID=UPI0021595C6F|nr:hypothetical protein [Paenibacillus endoradicis]MCR8657813.1 hypothetical protein [Paenibacillus endoradicis]